MSRTRRVEQNTDDKQLFSRVIQKKKTNKGQIFFIDVSTAGNIDELKSIASLRLYYLKAASGMLPLFKFLLLPFLSRTGNKSSSSNAK